MAYHPHNPLIIQSDKSVLLEVDNDRYEDARDALARFAELVKSPEHIHTYRITPLSLWNAAAAGMDAESIVAALYEYTKYDVPDNVVADIRDYVRRYGQLKLVRRLPGYPGDGSDRQDAADGPVLSAADQDLYLISDEPALIAEVAHHKTLRSFIVEQIGPKALKVNPVQRGRIKQALMHFGFPAQDLAGYAKGAELTMHMLDQTRSGDPFALRRYQREAADIFYAAGQDRGGSGVVVLPCGAGKTMVGIAAMAHAQCATLILTPSTVAARQWSNTRRLLGRISLIAAAWTLIAGAGIAALGLWLLPVIYGSEAIPAYPAILLLLVGYGFANIFNWNRPLLLALDKPAFPVLVSFACGVVALGFTFWLVPQHGYLMQAGLLSAYFVFSISIIVWRGLSEIRRLARQDQPAAVDGTPV